MSKCSMAQVFWVMVGFLLLPVVAWGEVGGESSLSLLSRPDAEQSYNLDLLASKGGVSSYSIASALSLSQAEAPSSLALNSTPDWDGIRKDTAHFMGYQLAIIGVLWVAPTSISGWTDETKEDFSFQQYKDNVRQIVWDKDDWWINYVLHPYWGGAYYVRAQRRGFGPVGSFWYAAALSSIYEFGAEAFFEEPSIQDLIVTPVAGYFVGKYFMEVRANIEKTPAGQRSRTDKFILVMTDPMGALNEKVDKLFGRTTHATLRPMFGPQFRAPTINEPRYNEPNQLLYTGTSDFGVKMALRW
jgi:hypothetical protein